MFDYFKKENYLLVFFTKKIINITNNKAVREYHKKFVSGSGKKNSTRKPIIITRGSKIFLYFIL